jgi:RNA polymerase sigma-70 factor (ECF subfamily)
MTIMIIEFADDLAFAHACILGEPLAQRQFVQRFGAVIEAALARHRVQPSDRADLRQALLERMLVDAPERPAKLRGYRGTASLASWLRVCVLREVLTLARRRRSSPEVPALAHEPGIGETPELYAVASERRERFELAFGAALRELEPRERNLLRHRVLHRLDQDQIAALYGVHRVTVARWFMRMRSKLRESTTRAIDRTDVLRSGVDVQLSGLLGRRCELEAVAI